jgi:hypothetical protein
MVYIHVRPDETQEAGRYDTKGLTVNSTDVV